MAEKSLIGDKFLSIEEVVEILDNGKPINLDESAWDAVAESSDFFDEIEEKGVSCYGINHSFGDLIKFSVNVENQDVLQERLVLSHSVGVGKIFPPHLSKLILFLRIRCFGLGVSGIKPETIKKLIKIYNSGVSPEICMSGSLGASGDLSPLSQLGAFLIGHGYGLYNGNRVTAKSIFEDINVKPPRLTRKEGLSLINGTSAMTAVAIDLHRRLESLFRQFLVGMAQFVDCCNLSTGFLNEEGIMLKNHSGARHIVEALREYIPDEGKLTHNKEKLQEVYSFRCVPYILNPVVDSLEYLKTVIEVELNSANDNPLYLKKGREIYHGGHFHGGSLAFALDQTRIAISLISGVIDRQLEHLFDRKNEVNLSPFFSLGAEKGFTGFAGAQYLVTSLNIEINHSTNPYCNRSIPTNGGNQDFVSLGLQSGLLGIEMIEKLKIILYIYFLAGVQGFFLTKRKPNNPKVTAIFDKISGVCSFPYDDSVMFSEFLQKAIDSKVLEKLIG